MYRDISYCFRRQDLPSPTPHHRCRAVHGLQRKRDEREERKNKTYRF